MHCEIIYRIEPNDYYLRSQNVLMNTVTITRSSAPCLQGGAPLYKDIAHSRGGVRPP